MATWLKRTRCSYMERRAAATPALKLPRNALRGTHAAPSAPRRTSPDPAVDANGGGISGWGSLLLSRRAQSTEARLGSRWLLACLAIQLRHARLPALPRAVCRVRLLSIGVRPAAALTPFLSIFGHVLCAGPRTAAREHSVAVQLFAAASRLMVMAFECDAVSLVMMESGKPKYSTLDATTQSFLPCFS